MLCQVLDFVPAIAQLTSISVDEADGALASGGIGEAVIECDHVVLSPQLAYVDADVSFRSGQGRELDLRAVLGSDVQLSLGGGKHAFSLRAGGDTSGPVRQY